MGDIKHVVGDPDFDDYTKDVLRPLVQTHEYNGMDALYFGRVIPEAVTILGTEETYTSPEMV